MRPRLLKVCALVLTLGIVAFVVQASRVRAREPVAPIASASAFASASAAPAPPLSAAARYGIIGPATKADPHVMRRAAEALLNGPSASPSAVAP
jgi:hypothetical protein